ncbi:uncharacterized protein LOC134689852 [Mytilus trossulus]|uniref:uncharacterized protein LOC134689852 n=1 Tax=Mytilus trossulus TaxID=6551 RepID=UPI0030064961
MRKRQQLSIIKDLIINKTKPLLTFISSGSLAEGIDLPGSDIDIMYVIDDVEVLRDIRNMKQPIQRRTLVMETDTDHPGFSRLRLIAEMDWENTHITDKCFTSTSTGVYLSANKFVSKINMMHPHKQQLSQHGPCFSDKGQNLDLAICLRSKYFPYSALPWASRYRQQWPPNSTIDKIKKYGCLLVPIGPRTMTDCFVFWRLSFSEAEKQLIHSFNFTQLLCYCLLKLTLKHIINTNRHVEGLLCSYFLKTALFWVAEELDIDTFQLSKLFVCFSHCLDKLKLWVKQCYCPNYFIPEHNMFIGKVNTDNNTILLNVLDGITCDGIDGLTKDIFPNNNRSSRLLRKNSESSFVKLDFLFFRTCFFPVRPDISKCLKALMFTESLMKSKYSTFYIEVCKHYHAKISQYTAQILPKPSITTETYKIHKQYHIQLQNGIKTDAVTGWLLYASFYYVTGQFEVTLRLTDYVISRCSPDMLNAGYVNFTEPAEKDILNYRSHVHSTMTLTEKMRMAIIGDVIFSQNSSLIPAELQLEANNHSMTIPSIVMYYFLRFLCFYHLCEISKKQQALHDFELIVKNNNYIPPKNVSNSLTILGVCYEISGDKDAAYQCYDNALQCEDFVCLSAKERRSKLLDI